MSARVRQRRKHTLHPQHTPVYQDGQAQMFGPRGVCPERCIYQHQKARRWDGTPDDMKYL
jgi:hypothetical protein